jgi:hypothetical protein
MLETGQNAREIDRKMVTYDGRMLTKLLGFMCLKKTSISEDSENYTHTRSPVYVECINL